MKSFQPTAVRGATLIVALVLLLVLTLIGLAASQVSMQQERMAGNYRETNEAFQSAEQTVREVERCLVDIYSQGASPFCDAQRQTWMQYEDSLGFDIGDLSDCTLETVAAGNWDTLSGWNSNSSIEDNDYLVISLDDSELDGNIRGSICRPMGEQDQTGGATYLIVARAPGPAGLGEAVVQTIFFWRA